MRRVFGGGEDLLAWCIPLGRWLGVRVGLHVIAPVWAAYELISAMPAGQYGLQTIALGVTAFLLVSLFRELCRAAIASRLGREVESIAIWPLGGLTDFGGPNARSTVGSDCGGLFAQFMLAPLLAAGVAYAVGGIGVFGSKAAAEQAQALVLKVLVFNPFSPSTPLADLASRPSWIVGIWWLYYANFVILGLNLFVPIASLDAGRIVRSIAAGRRGATGAGAARTAARVGFGACAIMFVLALAGGETHLISLALIGVGLTWMTLRRETFVADYEHGWQNEPTQTCVVGCCAPSETEVEDEEADMGTDEVDEPDPMRRAERHQPAAAHGTGRCMPQGASKPPVAPSDSDLDAILAKISSSGMASLTETERETLRKATEAKRKT